MQSPDTVDLQALPTYLGAEPQWRPVRSNDRRTIWEHDSGARVFVPTVMGPDYGELVDQAIERLADAERRPVDDIEIDVTYYMFDKLHVRRVGADRGLPLNDGLAFHQALHDLVRASALAAREKRAHYAGGQADEIGDYLSKVRLIPARQGSFVARALLPLDVAAPDEPLIPVPVSVSDDARAVAMTLITGASTAVEMAQAFVRGDTGVSWEQGIHVGVSAEMCDALARLLGPAKAPDDVDLKVRWTWRAPTDADPHVTVPRGLGPVLRAGHDHLKRAPGPVTVMLLGRVTALHREPRVGPGDVTVTGDIEGLGARKLRINLDERTYNRAATAHRDGKTVEVRAVVVQEPGKPIQTRRTIRFIVKRDRPNQDRGTLFEL